jgi:hypothetical protein
MRQIRKLKLRKPRSTQPPATEPSGYSRSEITVELLLKRIDAVLDESALGPTFDQK